MNEKLIFETLKLLLEDLEVKTKTDRMKLKNVASLLSEVEDELSRIRYDENI